jgi:hypothetical protein
MIEIMNLRKSKPSRPSDVKVDRSSILGNPFPMNGESQRDAVCDQYKPYHAKRMTGSSSSDLNFQKEMYRLKALYLKHGKLRLFCWCAPKRCHVSTIKQWILDNS